jgi:Uma2 family endonuclease
MVATKLMTAQELANLPDDGFRYELIRGELIRMPPPGGRHGRRQARMAQLFLNYADVFGGWVTGESGFHIEVDPDTVLAPDVAYIRPDRIAAEDFEQTYPQLAPDVAVEIDSPSSRRGERRRKLLAYHKRGTRLVLLVDEMRRTITVEHADGRTEVLGDADVFDGGDAMPGFRVSVADFFR